ncbi:hypothetical protein OEZ85_012234 [Tetradesmus obliquus]|uniref:RING-type domain-containing protein n=1 Tax=Tetradesmus obliquus TaxID=3088 RepID=A0ABY8TT26_TETOB|nr:hypothetical protein OEZ85_012234 [Tetradesmus obliquus]
MVSASNTRAISYSLASKLLGQVIPSPATREGRKARGESNSKGTRAGSAAAKQPAAASTRAISNGVKETDKQQMETVLMVEYGLASRLLGQSISSPVVRRLQGEFDDPQDSSTQLAAPTTAEAAADAACRKCSGHVGSMHGVTGKVRRPKGWRKDCIACLEADWPLGDLYHAESLPGGSGDADDENDEGAELQAVVAGTLAYALFVDKGLPFSKRVTVDTSDVPSTPDAGMSRACVSCVSNWVLDESMDVADEFDLVVHCHMCLHEFTDAAEAGVPGSERVQVMLWFALASRYVGEYVTAPEFRERNKGDKVYGSGSMLGGASAAAAGQPSSGQSGKRGAARNVHKPSRATSSSKHNQQQQQQQQRIPQAAQYGLNHEATGLFTWADSTSIGNHSCCINHRCPVSAASGDTTGMPAAANCESGGSNDDDVEGDESLCVVCWERPRSIIVCHFHPRLTAQLCGVCYAAYNTRKGCPLCRRPVEDAVGLSV